MNRAGGILARRLACEPEPTVDRFGQNGSGRQRAGFGVRPRAAYVWVRPPNRRFRIRDCCRYFWPVDFFELLDDSTNQRVLPLPLGIAAEIARNVRHH